MKPTKPWMWMLPLLILIGFLILPSCEINPIRIGPGPDKVTTVWAKMGTPGKIVSDTEVDLLIEVDGKPVKSRANVQGMIVLDEPTYTQLLKQWKARQMVDVDVTPESEVKRDR